MGPAEPHPLPLEVGPHPLAVSPKMIWLYMYIPTLAISSTYTAYSCTLQYILVLGHLALGSVESKSPCFVCMVNLPEVVSMVGAIPGTGPLILE